VFILTLLQMKKSEKSMTAILASAMAEGPIDYARYIETVLYTPEVGYYTRARERVGRNQQSDFYTAESLGSVFAECVIAAACNLLGKECTPADFSFIEIAAEPGCGLLQSVTHPFKDSRILRQGEALQVSGQSVVFANEWLDALPFHRLCFYQGHWRECGVAITQDGELRECFLPEPSPAVKAIHGRLPEEAQEGYRLDLPLAAEAALRALLEQGWTGVLMLFDYGQRWDALLHDLPQGTARTYYRHTQGSDLLATPGERDITCDVIWDPLQAISHDTGFSAVSVQRQESFFMHHAQEPIARIMQAQVGQFSPQRQTLMELLHPGNLGHRFQVLNGQRLQTKEPIAKIH
jgi:SAM-dependent MidA family methyltransferase